MLYKERFATFVLLGNFFFVRICYDTGHFILLFYTFGLFGKLKRRSTQDHR